MMVKRVKRLQAKNKKKKKKKKVSPEEARRRRAETRFKTDIRTVFTNAGFDQVPSRDRSITVGGLTGDLDAVFLFENLIVVVEDTTLASSSIGGHLRKKVEFFRRLRDHFPETFSTLRETFERFDAYVGSKPYLEDEYEIRFVYAARNTVDESYRTRYQDTTQVLSYASLQYFLSLTKTIKRSARYELLKFLKVPLADVGNKSSAVETSVYTALLLPEVPSGFPSGHKLVSFLVDPATLLERSYVLRADSWRDREALYQRLLVKNKITSMRKYLVEEHRVFVNNIIVTLRPDATFEPSEPIQGKHKRTHITAGKLTIPRRFDAVGIIDGQHRVFSYHEGDDALDAEISKLRSRQHLLVTGIMYPRSVKPHEAEAFEAKLFLEINDKQKRVRADLKQSIQLLIDPCSDVAVAKAVLERLGSTGPLSDHLALYFFDTGKLKTASIVSYGLRHIVALDAPVSFFNVWDGAKKALREEDDPEALAQYVRYCASELNKLLGALKDTQPAELWTTNRKVSRLVTTTTINGVVFCARLLIENGRLNSFDHYKARLSRLDIDFTPGNFEYKSSHWRQLGRKMYEAFGEPGAEGP